MRRPDRRPFPHVVESINPLACHAWDTSVARLPGATFFHSRAWAQVLHETYGFSPHYLVAISGGRMAGLAAIMEVDSWLTGRRGVALPFTDHCPTLGASEVREQLHATALERAALRRWRRYEVHGDIGTPGAQPSLSYFHHVLDLSPGIGQLERGMDSAVVRGIRKAMRLGLRIEVSQDWAAMAEFHRLFCITRRKHGAPPQPMAFFRRIHERVLEPGHGRVLLARSGDAVVAAAMFFEFAGTVLFKFGASDPAHQELRPNNLLFRHAIEYFQARGAARLDFGRTSLDNEGLCRFKRSWGATEERLDYFRINCRTHEYVTERDQTHGWHTGVFKHLPAWAARLIGSAAYRHIA